MTMLSAASSIALGSGVPSEVGESTLSLIPPEMIAICSTGVVCVERSVLNENG
jgi:hypothetical protein